MTKWLRYVSVAVSLGLTIWSGVFTLAIFVASLSATGLPLGFRIVAVLACITNAQAWFGSFAESVSEFDGLVINEEED